MQAHAHRDRARLERHLAGIRGGDRTGGRRERHEEGVALRIDLYAAMSRERRPQGTAMIGERLGVGGRTELAQKASRALDVGEQERHRPRRQVTAACPEYERGNADATSRSGSVASVRVGVRLIQYLGTPAEIVDLAVHAEECGLDEVWVPHDPFMTSAWA